MNPLLRILENWSTHQDYVWFLAVLAWGGVFAAEYRRKETLGAPASRWVMALAGSQIVGALLELVLLAQDLMVPYTWLDLAMGAAQAAGAAAMVWGATTHVRGSSLWRAIAFLLLAAFAALRYWMPIESGFALCIVQAIAVLGLLRQIPRPISALTGCVLVIAPTIATHGPWAYAINEGRRTTDWSHFALFAAAAVLTTGALLAAAAWQRQLKEAMPDAAASGALRRDLRRALMLLALWLVGGVLLAVWYGRQARRAYEESLLRRVETLVLALDSTAVAEALGPDLRIEKIERKQFPDGRPVDVATVPNTREPVYARLRNRLSELRSLNPDFRLLYLATWRQGHVLMLGSSPRENEAITHVIHHDVTSEDLARIASRTSYLEGPFVNPGQGAKFSAKAPLFQPQTGQVLGWLVADIDSTRWAATFTQARLQTMALVAAGVGLWAVAVAYRLRREARDAAVQKAAAAGAADRMKSAFLAKVSHELRTPIQSVLGYGELLAGASLSETQRTWLAALRSHGEIMLRLVNDLIDLGALQSGAFQLQPAPLNLRALIADSAASLRPAASTKGLAYHVEVDATVPTWINADGVRLRQVLLNLLTNAVKFTSAGRVKLSVGASADGAVEFAVSDTGPGIPVELRSRLFQPFARLDPAASGGSGLGLALVQGLCAVMGGSVRFVDTTEPGATFVARLPLARCEPPATGIAEAPAAAPSFAGLRVLVAEDNTLVRELLTAFLTGNGAEVMTAADGPTALTLARDRAPDVLLLDIALPGLDGIAVAEALRRDGRAALRIIGLSAHASAADEARARNAGMDVFLAKPVSLARLAQALTEPAGGRSLPPTPEPAAKISDERLRARLAAQFASETPRVLAEMRAALAMGDWSRLRRSAHYLKNSADVLGASVLQDACQRLAVLERADPATARQLLEAVEAAVPSRFFLRAETAAPDRN